MRTERALRFLAIPALAAALLSGGPAAAQPLVRNWNVAGNGNWNTNTNWAPAVVPNGANIEADFLTQKGYFGPINITLQTPVTLNRMVFDSASAYTITPQNNATITLTTFNDNGTTRQPRIVVQQANTGNQTIAAPIVMGIANKSDLSIQVSGSSPTLPRLTLTGVISSPAGQTNGISKTGNGALLLGAANTYTGNTYIHTGSIIATVSGALGPGGANGGTVQVSSGASLILGQVGQLNYNNGQQVVLRGMGVTSNGSPIGALSTGIGAFVDFNGPIRLASNAAIGAPSTGNNLDPQLNLTGVISGAGNLNKVGGGVVQLATANTYTGTTDIQAGVLSVSANNALGKGDITVEQGATLNFNNVQYIAGPGQAKAHVILNGGLGSQNNGQIRVFENTSSFNGTITLAASSSIGVYGKSAVLDFSGTINESAAGSGLTKLGPGTLILEKGSTYTGATLVQGGTLFVNNGKNGSATGAGNVTIAPGASLMGNGNIAGKVIDQNQGNIQPMKAAGAGLISIGGGLAMATGSIYTWTLSTEIDGRNALANPGTDFSVLQLTGGQLELDAGAVLDLNLAGPGTTPSASDPFWSTEHEWDIIALDSPSINPSSLAFDVIENGTYANGSFSTIVDNGLEGYGNAGDILLIWNPNLQPTLAAVPAPPSWYLFLIGATASGLAAWQRRNRP